MLTVMVSSQDWMYTPWEENLRKLLLKKWIRTGKTAQKVKHLPGNHDSLRLIPGTHVKVEADELHRLSLTSIHALCPATVLTIQ